MSVDNNRRKFLKLILIGGGTFIAGKVLGPLFSKLLEEQSTKNGSTAFQTIDDKTSFSVYDDSGEEILQIDKGV